jgi:hypothetical protein
MYGASPAASTASTPYTQVRITQYSLVTRTTTYAPVLRTPSSYVLRSTCDRFASSADRFLSLSPRLHQ